MTLDSFWIWANAFALALTAAQTIVGLVYGDPLPWFSIACAPLNALTIVWIVRHPFNPRRKL